MVFSIFNKNKRGNNMNLQQVNKYIMSNTNIEVLDLIIQEAKERIHTLASKKKVAKPMTVAQAKKKNEKKKAVVKELSNKEKYVWNTMTDKQKIEYLKKLVNNGSGKKNPLTGNKIVDDADEIEKIGEKDHKVFNKLEDYWFKHDCGTSAEFDDFIISYQDDIIKDILNGVSVTEIVKEYKEYC